MNKVRVSYSRVSDEYKEEHSKKYKTLNIVKNSNIDFKCSRKQDYN